jgi:hypothetical protein
MHNMIIEYDRKNRVRTHVGPYECQSPLAEVDHDVLADFADFLAITQRSVKATFTSNFNMISLNICGGLKDYQQMRRRLDLDPLILLVSFFIVF